MSYTPEQEKIITRIMKEEWSRTTKEKYSCKKIGGWWLVIPYSYLLIGGIILFFSLKANNFNWPLMISMAVAVYICAVTMDQNEKWQIRMTAKSRISERNPNYRFTDYRENYLYTDSTSEARLYKIAKILCYIIGIIGAGILSLLAFLWLGSITITPTTVIIILLVIIIYNQEQNNKRNF